MKRRICWLGVLGILGILGCYGHVPSQSAEASVEDGRSQFDAGSDIDAASDAGTALVIDLDRSYTPPAGGDASASTLDVYYRPDGAPKRLVLLVHGGAWVSGDKENFYSEAPDFIPWWIARDYVVVAVNFRLATPLGSPLTVGPRDQARDIAYALKWVADHAEDYGITENGAVALGFSSGAHLVALLGADGTYLQEVGLPETHLAATLSFDVHAYDVPFALGLMIGSTVEQNIPLITHLFGDNEPEQLAASPISYLDGYVAPALLLSAEPALDQVGSHGYVAGTASSHYADALIAEGHTAAFHHLDQETHSSLVLDFGSAGDEPTTLVDTFLDATF